MTEPRTTNVDGYTQPTTGRAVVGHSKTVHVNPQGMQDTKAKATAVGDALSQEAVEPSGIAFLADGETAAKEYTLPDGRRVGMNAETVELARKAQEARKRFDTEKTPEALEAKRAAEKAYKVAFAGSTRNYSLAEVHMAADVAYMVRPPSKEEQELRDLMQEARRVGDELGVEIVKPTPAYEEFMRASIREGIKTPEDAARYMLGGRGTEKDIQKVLKRQKPGFLQRRVTKIEIKRVRRAIEEAKNSQNPT